jgi:D-3-phosphoglycerate dehydrogenase
MAGYKVLIPQNVAEEGKNYLRERGYEIKMGSGVANDDIAKDVADCDAILARTAAFPAKVLEAGKGLKVIARHGVGFDNIDVPRATELGIWVTFTPEALTNTVAEYTIGCIIALARNFIRFDRELRTGNWQIRDKMTGIDLAGKVLGVVGLGRIGRCVAKKAALGLDMQVIGYDPFLKPDQFGELAIRAKTWEDIFTASDFITLHMPGTEATRDMIGKKEFEKMKKTAYVINAARGSVVNESDLIEALRSETIAGAALDVYRKEPPEMDNPLFTMSNVLLTPHNASLTGECMVRLALHAAQGIDEVLSGRQPTWPVNRPIQRR